MKKEIETLEINFDFRPKTVGETIYAGKVLHGLADEIERNGLDGIKTFALRHFGDQFFAVVLDNENDPTK